MFLALAVSPGTGQDLEIDPSRAVIALAFLIIGVLSLRLLSCPVHAVLFLLAFTTNSPPIHLRPRNLTTMGRTLVTPTTSFTGTTSFLGLTSTTGLSSLSFLNPATNPDDPFYAFLRPPPDETPDQRVQREGREAEAKRRSDEIDEMLRMERAAERKKKGRGGGKPVKVMLLGQSESGAYACYLFLFLSGG